MKNKLILTFLFIASVAQLFAYPISPLPLRKMLEISSIIVIADIDNPDPINPKDTVYDPETNEIKYITESFSFGGDGLADLHILEVLKGELSEHHIQVKYESYICPAPPHYPDKKIVVAFLYKEDSATAYRTVGLSYGTRIMKNEEELVIFKKRIEEYFEIKKIRGKRKRKIATVEWLVKCAEQSPTRWDGTYELCRGTDFMSFYDRTKDENFQKFLSPEHRERIKSAFYRIDTTTYEEIALIWLFERYDGQKLVNHLCNALPENHGYNQSSIMETICQLLKDEELKSLYEKWGEYKYYNKEFDEQRQTAMLNYIARVRFLQNAGH